MIVSTVAGVVTITLAIILLVHAIRLSSLRRW